MSRGFKAAEPRRGPARAKGRRPAGHRSGRKENVNQRATGFRTTHTGSLPRPPALTSLQDAGQVTAAVGDLVRRQLEAGIDIVNDGEASKPSYATYVTERLTGFGGSGRCAATRAGPTSSPSSSRAAAGAVGHHRHPGLRRAGRLPGHRARRGRHRATSERRRPGCAEVVHVRGLAGGDRALHAEHLLRQQRGVHLRARRRDEDRVRRDLPRRVHAPARLPRPRPGWNNDRAWTLAEFRARDRDAAGGDRPRHPRHPARGRAPAPVLGQL